MHRLKDVDYLPRRAPVEVVDVEHDPVDGRRSRRAGPQPDRCRSEMLRVLLLLPTLPLFGPGLHQCAELLEVLADGGDEAELAAVVLATCPIGEEVVQPLAGAGLRELGPELSHTLDDLVELGLEHRLACLGLPQLLELWGQLTVGLRSRARVDVVD